MWMNIQIRWRCNVYRDRATIICLVCRIIRALSGSGSLRSVGPGLSLPNTELLNEITILAYFYLYNEHQEIIQDQSSAQVRILNAELTSALNY
jgi:hypothetical protein